MYTRVLITTIFAFLLAACTIEPDGADIKSELHLPFTYSQWESRQLATPEGQQACVVTSGHNGLTFVVRKSGQGNIVSVQSNRPMRPGTWIMVTVNGNRYETSNAYFSAQDALVMARDFSVGDKAYAEWSEIRAYNGRTRHSAIYKLNGFKHKFEACQK